MPPWRTGLETKAFRSGNAPSEQRQADFPLALRTGVLVQDEIAYFGASLLPWKAHTYALWMSRLEAIKVPGSTA